MRNIILGLSLIAASIVAQAAQTTVPYTFTSNKAPTATQLNANFQALVTAVNGLSTRVDKLEGKLTANDVVGLYKVYGIQNELLPFNGGGEVDAYVHTGSVKLNADGTYSITFTENGSNLIISGDPLSKSQRTTHRITTSTSGTWSLSGNTITFSGLNNGSPVTLSMVSGGRIMVTVSSNTSDGTSTLIFFVRY